MSMQPARIEFLTALLRGWHGKCPRCGAGTLFASFLKMRSHCPSCDLALEPYRADDAPAYFTILAVGHIVVPLVLVMERYRRCGFTPCCGCRCRYCLLFTCSVT